MRVVAGADQIAGRAPESGSGGAGPLDDRSREFVNLGDDASWRQTVKRASLVNLSVLLVSFFLCALVLEVASRLLFEAPPSVVLENLSGPEAFVRPLRERENITLKDGRIYSKAVPDSGFYIHTPMGRRLRRSVSGAITGHHLSRTDVEFSTNSLGYRDEEVGEKTDRDYRILALGDSITLGDYLPADQTYPEYLERSLIAAEHPALEGRDVRVINSGVGAIDLQNEFAILMETGVSVEPDVVLVGLFLNDAYHSPVLEIRRLSPALSWSHFLKVSSMWLDVFRDRYVYEGTGLRDEDAIEQERERFLATHSAAKGDWHSSQDAFHKLIAGRIGGWGYAWSGDFWPKIVPILELMKQVGDDRGFRLAVMLFPVSYQVQSELLMDEPQRDFGRHMKKLGVAHIDLLPLLREKYQRDGVNVYYDHCHYRSEGHEFFTKAVADFLLREVISR